MKSEQQNKRAELQSLWLVLKYRGIRDYSRLIRVGLFCETQGSKDSQAFFS